MGCLAWHSQTCSSAALWWNRQEEAFCGYCTSGADKERCPLFNHPVGTCFRHLTFYWCFCCTCVGSIHLNPASSLFSLSHSVLLCIRLYFTLQHDANFRISFLIKPPTPRDKLSHPRLPQRSSIFTSPLCLFCLRMIDNVTIISRFTGSLHCQILAFSLPEHPCLRQRCTTIAPPKNLSRVSARPGHV